MTQYHTEVDICHSLHSMNAIRKSIHKEYCGSHEPCDETGFPHNWDGIHIGKAFDVHKAHIRPAFNCQNTDHCLDQIIQSLICHNDSVQSLCSCGKMLIRCGHLDGSTPIPLVEDLGRGDMEE